MKELESYKKFLFAGIIVIALGIAFTTTLKETAGSFGTVMIAVGGLLFIIAMSKKQKAQKENKPTEQNED
jgi:small neutral amino acid transporter SnatA (MarC family)